MFLALTLVWSTKKLSDTNLIPIFMQDLWKRFQSKKPTNVCKSHFSVLPKTANLVFDWSELLIFCCTFALIISSYQESNLENLVNQIKTKAQNVLSETCDIHQSTDYENQYFCWLKLILTQVTKKVLDYHAYFWTWYFIRANTWLNWWRSCVVFSFCVKSTLFVSAIARGGPKGWKMVSRTSLNLYCA